MAIRVKSWSTSAGPRWQRIERRSNGRSFSSGEQVVAEGGKPESGNGRRRRKAGWAVLEDGGERALVLNVGHVYDVEIHANSSDNSSSVRIDASRKIAVVDLTTDALVISVTIDSEAVDEHTGE